MRTSLGVVLIMGLACSAGPVSAQSGPQNLDFEGGTLGQTPPGWFVPTPGYAATLVAEAPRQGRMCVHLRADASARQSPFGNIMQSFDAQDYHGKMVRLRAAIRARADGRAARVQMWMRVDRAGGQSGFFDNMQHRPIRKRDWAYYEIAGEVDTDASRVNIGLIITGEAEAWFDEVTFEAVGVFQPAPVEPPRALSDRGLENLTAFARLFGYVRYFHPSDEAAEADWDALAVAGVRAVDQAESSAELARMLRALFEPIAPTAQIFQAGETVPLHAALKPPAAQTDLRLRFWKHRGLDVDSTTPVYVSDRVSIAVRPGALPADVPNPAEPIAADLGGGVACLVPMAVYAGRGGTIPDAIPGGKGGTPVVHFRYTGDDRATRLADVVLCWNVMQHFYPYFDVVNTDWAAKLAPALRAAATDEDGRQFLDTLQRLIAALHDGHGNVQHGSYGPDSALPLYWDWVEGTLVVTHVRRDAGADGLMPGDIVVRIDGRAALEAIRDAEQFVSAATPQDRRHQALLRLASGRRGEQVVLTIEDAAGRQRSARLTRSISPHGIREPRPGKVQEIEAGIYYLDFDRITDQEFTDALPRLASAKGIVFDFRGYPGNIQAMTFFPHIIQRPVVSPQWHIPVIREPDRRNMTFERAGQWHLSPAEPYLEARKVFIIDARCISYAESCLGIVEHFRLGDLVGTGTAGTNGNINRFKLPGDYHVVWTGMKVLKQDGSQHHGVGIRPTVPVTRTIRGIREGRDELLEAALQVARPE